MPVPPRPPVCGVGGVTATNEVPLTRPLALVTGASSGIGEDLARVFAREGWDLVLVARNGEKLRALGAELETAHGIQCLALPADLSEPSAPEAVWKALAGRPLEALVNNAGYAVAGSIAEVPLAAELGMFQVNVLSLVALTKLALPGMLARKSGRILNVASTVPSWGATTPARPSSSATPRRSPRNCAAQA